MDISELRHNEKVPTGSLVEKKNREREVFCIPAHYYPG